MTGSEVGALVLIARVAGSFVICRQLNGVQTESPIQIPAGRTVSGSLVRWHAQCVLDRDSVRLVDETGGILADNHTFSREVDLGPDPVRLSRSRSRSRQ